MKSASKTLILHTKAHAEALAARILKAVITKPLLVTVEFYKKNRSIEQNKLQRKWLGEAAEQLGEFTAEGYRGFSKLHFGVPIMHTGDEVFREAYDRLIAPMPYEMKIELMQLPFDFAVTRLMNAAQKSEYLNCMYEHFTGLGVQLTNQKDRFDEENEP